MRDVNENAVMVFTSDNIDELVLSQKTGFWVMNRSRAARCKYVIVSRKATGRSSMDQAVNGEGAFVARITKLEPQGDRTIIHFENVQRMYVPNMWPGFQNPVTYVNAIGQGVPVDVLERVDNSGGQPTDEKHPLKERINVKGLIDVAKLSLARALGIPPEAVKITIEM